VPHSHHIFLSASDEQPTPQAKYIRLPDSAPQTYLYSGSQIVSQKIISRSENPKSKAGKAYTARFAALLSLGKSDYFKK
ncbi:hypothetical protein, partial [Nostoc sp.]